MRYPKTPLAHAKEIVEANPDRVFFLIADDNAAIQAFGADVISPSVGLAHVTQPVVAIDLGDPAWSPALVGRWLIDVIDHKIFEGHSFMLVGNSEQAKTYSMRSFITLWV